MFLFALKTICVHHIWTVWIYCWTLQWKSDQEGGLIKLTDEIISEINLVNEKIPNPAP